MERRFHAMLAVLMLVMCRPGGALAAESLVPPVPGDICLGFGVPYAEDGHERTHRGLDFTGVAGETVHAACAGTVTFAGEVPADGGGRVGAVTVSTPGDVLVTVSPLASVSVCVGHQISPGDAVGTLAPAGDGSTRVAHVHLSVRSGGVYVDPSAMLAEDVEAGRGTQRSAPGTDQQPTDQVTAPARSGYGSASATGKAVLHADARSTDAVGQLPGMSARVLQAGTSLVDTEDRMRIQHAYRVTIDAFRCRRPHAALEFAQPPGPVTWRGLSPHVEPPVLSAPIASTIVAVAIVRRRLTAVVPREMG